MDFDLSEEQSLLKDSIERLLKDRYGFEQRKAVLASAEGYSAEMWRGFAEMGLTALPFAEADGGLGGGPVETAIVMEALGGAISLEPYLATVVLGGGFVRLGGSDAQKAALIPAIASGELKLAFAQVERNSRFDLHHVETTARKSGSGWTLDGKKFVVVGAPSADRLIVTARTAGGARDEAGIGVFLVDAAAKGVSIRAHANQDGQRAAEVTLEGVAAEAIGDPANGLPLVRRVVDAAIAALCAEAIGVMSAMHVLTVEYLKVRKQFGVPIGSFQVLQHKAVDMFVAIEQARSITLYATTLADSEDDAERTRAMHAAKAEIGRAGRIVGENAIQLHGGVGMTMELAIGHYFKRMAMINLTFGDDAHHLAALAAMGGLMAA
ncbi:MAG: acyl-CoA dehydrogenase family protein [Rhizobiaceae bacterium]|nr:acyl-CoA dehydrogenase family protein [Rhizobiaceae bacterium]